MTHDFWRLAQDFWRLKSRSLDPENQSPPPIQPERRPRPLFGLDGVQQFSRLQSLRYAEGGAKLSLLHLKSEQRVWDSA